MTELIKKHRENESGFSLVEILVVVLIIGVLSAIAIPMFLNQRKAANEAALKSDIHTIQVAMQNCAVKGGAYPDLWINWGAIGTSKPGCISDINVSTGTRTHSFDFGAYYSASGVKIGEAFCIESANDSAGIAYYYRSDKGQISTTVCQNQ